MSETVPFFHQAAKSFILPSNYPQPKKSKARLMNIKTLLLTKAVDKPLITKIFARDFF